MSISTEPVSAPQAKENGHESNEPVDDGSAAATKTPPKTSLDTSSTNHSVDPTADFAGDLETDNTLPTEALLRKIEDYQVLDKDGKARPFKSLYTGPNVTRRVLVIFIRHFFCGNCQEYLRALSKSIDSDALLQLPVPTFIVIVGCGSPSLIPMYQEATQSPYPIYADPSRRLYQELGMVKTLALGSRPEYMRQGMMTNMVRSVFQMLGQVKTGKAHLGGTFEQVGGEFLFEPKGEIFASPVVTPAEDANKTLGDGEEKRVTWCHRMKNTRDHAEIPELREILGLDGLGTPGKNERRWSRAVTQRKGTGLSAMSVAQKDEAAARASLSAVPEPPKAN